MEGYTEESLANQVELYERAFNLLDSDSAREAFSLEFFDLSKISKIRNIFGNDFIGFTFEEVENFLESFKNRNYSLDFFIDFSTKIGLGEDLGDLSKRVQEHAQKKIDYQNIVYDLENQTVLQLTKKQISELEKEKSDLEDYFRNEGQIFEKTNPKDLIIGDYFQNEGKNFFEDFLLEGFSAKNIKEIINDFSENYNDDFINDFIGEGEYDPVEHITQIMSDLIPSFDQIYGKASNIGEVIEKAFSLEDELAKGNRQAFNDLATELGENGDEILESFLKNKDPFILQNH